MIKDKTIFFFIIATYILTLLLVEQSSILANAISQATPTISAFIVTIFTKNRIKSFKELGLLNIGKTSWYVVCLIVPSSAIIISYFVATGLGYFSVDLKAPWYTLIYYTFLSIWTWPFLWALTEEIGWRGFLQPKLTKKFGIPKGILITGIIWAVWHFIFIFSGNYYDAGNAFINTILFTITIVLMSFFIGFIRIASHSLWPCVVFHSTSNAILQACTYQFNIKNPYYIYISGEAGIINIIFWGIVLLIIFPKLVRQRP